MLLGFQERRRASEARRHQLWPHPVPGVQGLNGAESARCSLQLGRTPSAPSPSNRSPLDAMGTLSLAKVTGKVVPGRRETVSLLLDTEGTLDKPQLLRPIPILALNPDVNATPRPSVQAVPGTGTTYQCGPAPECWCTDADPRDPAASFRSRTHAGISGECKGHASRTRAGPPGPRPPLSQPSVAL